jgi:hypothetical protein
MNEPRVGEFADRIFGEFLAVQLVAQLLHRPRRRIAEQQQVGAGVTALVPAT